MLRQVFQGCAHLSKVSAATPAVSQTEWAFTRALSASCPLFSLKKFDRRKDAVRQGVNQDDNQSPKNKTSEIAQNRLRNNTFPNQQTFNKVFNGITYNRLPIIHIKATNNNTIISATDSDGVVLALQSGGTAGFRNARRGTNVAAQAAAIALAGDVLRKDIKAARVCLKGIGPGRLPALKAIQLSGVDVISITDTTPLPHNGNRPKKVRRL